MALTATTVTILVLLKQATPTASTPYAISVEKREAKRCTLYCTFPMQKVHTYWSSRNLKVRIVCALGDGTLYTCIWKYSLR